MENKLYITLSAMKFDKNISDRQTRFYQSADKRLRKWMLIAATMCITHTGIDLSGLETIVQTAHFLNVIHLSGIQAREMK